MVYFILILVVAAFVCYKGYDFPNAKQVKKLCKGKTDEQKKTIYYFLRKGWLAKIVDKIMTDDEYKAMVRAKRDSFDFKSKALAKIGLDESEVSEIPPVMLEGFVYDNAYAKQTDNGKWISSSYQVAWLFFSSTQVYLYLNTFNLDENKKKETTNEFFYKDVTSFSTFSETDSANSINGGKVEVETNKFLMVVPGDKFPMAMGDVEDADSIIQAMKQKLREKKQ